MSRIQPFSIVVLAGGLATRLRPMTTTLPKSMIEIAGKPFIHHQLKCFERQGIEHAVICLGFLGEQIQAYVERNRHHFNLNVEFSYDGDKLLGTAGAIKKTLHQLSDNFFVIYGDSFLSCDFNKVKNHFINSKKLALMTVYKNHNQGDKSNIVFQNSKITSYDKINQTLEMQHIDYGLGVFNKAAFEKIPDADTYDLAVLYQALLAENKLEGFEVEERFYEIGSFSGIEEASDFIKKEGCI